MTNKLPTNLLIQLDTSTLPYEEDPILPTEVGELEMPVNLAPRYYIKIYPPAHHNSTGHLVHKAGTYHIPRSGLLANTLKLKLNPSIGYGINSCYRVEYYSYIKTLLPRDYNLKYPFRPISPTKLRHRDIPQLKHEHLKTEYWYIPNRDGSINVDGYGRNSIDPYLHGRWIPRVNKPVSIDIERRDSSPDLQGVDFLDNPYHLEIVSVDSIISDHEWQDFELYQVPSYPFITSLTNESITSNVGIAWGPAQPRPGTIYTLKYTPPFRLKDIQFIEETRLNNLYPRYYYDRGLFY